MQKVEKTNIKVTGIPKDLFIPISATISYQVGMLPTCQVSFIPGPSISGKIKESDWSFLNTLDELRRKELCVVIMNVFIYNSNTKKTDNKTVRFVGYIDGYGISQGVGSQGFTVNFISELVYLREANTVGPGISSIGNNVLVPFLSTEKTITGIDKIKMVSQSDIPADANYVEGYIKFQQMQAKRFSDPKLLEASLSNNGGEGASKFQLDYFKERLQVYKPKYDQVISILQSAYNLDYLKQGLVSSFFYNIDQSIDHATDRFYQTGGDFFNNIGSMLGNMGLAQVPIDKLSIMVMPDHGFIKMTHEKPKEGKQSDKPNVAFPQDYISYSYNDSQFRNIGQVVLLDSMASRAYKQVFEPYAVIQGVYPPSEEPNGLQWTQQGDILYYPLDQQFSQAGTYIHNQPPPKEFVKNIADTKQAVQPIFKTMGFEEFLDQAEEWMQGTYKDTQTRMNYTKDAYAQMAQTIYYKAVYEGRVGSINLEFNSKWVPGLPGYLYTRSPGVWLDFLVTSVTHTVGVSNGDGYASTSVSFSSGRYCTDTTSVGIEKDLFYAYGKEQIDTLAQTFINQVT